MNTEENELMTKTDSNNWRAEFNTIEPLSTYYSIYIVGKSNKMGVVRIIEDTTVEYAIPLEYDEINIFFKNNYLLLARKIDKKRVIKVTHKNTILSQFYDKIGTFVSYVGLIPVANGDLVGAIDKNLNEIIPIQYDMLDNQAFHIINVGKWSRPALILRKTGKYGILKVTGETLLPFEYDEIDEGLYYRHKPSNPNILITFNTQISGSGLIAVKKNKKWGLIDEVKFNVVAPCIYKSIRQKTLNKIELIKEIGHDLVFLTKEGPKIQSVPTKKLEQYSKVGKYDDYGFAIVQKDDKYGYIDEEYNEVLHCTYDEIRPFINGVAIVKKNGKYGYINEKCNEVTPCIYDEVLQLTNGIAVVRIGQLFGAIDREGNTCIPFDYLILANLSCGEPTMLMAVKEKKFGVIDKKNNIIIPFEFDWVFPAFGMIRVGLKKKMGVYNHRGQLLVPIEYDDIQHPSITDRTINVCNNGKWGVVDKKGQIICEPRYDIIDSYGFACGRLAVCRNNKWGFINRNGREVIECIYDKVYQFFEENHCEVKYNGKKIIIDTYGNRINTL